MAGHHSLSSVGQIKKMFVVSAYGVLNLQTNIVKFNFFINAHLFSVKKKNSSLYGPYTKDINTYVYI